MALKTLFEAAGIGVPGDGRERNEGSLHPDREITPCAATAQPAATTPQAATPPAPPKPRPSDLDPRPDLHDDHRLWIAVLTAAWQMDKHLHGLLHGLRCCDARLTYQAGRLKLDYQPVLAESSILDEQRLRSEWLDPRKEQIKECFGKAAWLIGREEAEKAERKAG